MRKVTPMKTPSSEKPLFIFCDQIIWSASLIASKKGMGSARLAGGAGRLAVHGVRARGLAAFMGRTRELSLRSRMVW